MAIDHAAICMAHVRGMQNICAMQAAEVMACSTLSGVSEAFCRDWHDTRRQLPAHSVQDCSQCHDIIVVDRRRHYGVERVRMRAVNLPVDEDLLDLDRQVCFPLYAASNLLNRLYRPILGDLGLTYPQYLVMLVLWKHTPQTVGSLGDMLHLDSGTLTPLLKRMELAGLISRTRDADDERRVLIDLTAKGRGLRADAEKVPVMLSTGLAMDADAIAELRSRVRELVEVLREVHVL